jgi:type IV pilus assembly protein PilM
MLNTKSFLTVDFGAGSLKLAEFEINEQGGLRLNDFAIKPLGLEGAQDATREKLILSSLQGLIVEHGLKSKNVNVCAPGFHVFSKFVKLPPVDSGKVDQIIQYEAQQNVPFPLAEVVWDYQILGTAPGGELEVLLVAIKSDIVEGLFRVAAEAKLNLQLCDASPAALCNAFRYNYGELDDCTMLLDIGAKTSNLLFFEKGKVFSRSINLGANAITQDFANESKLKFDDAERIKIAEGFVSLGGAYEEPENPYQAAISKIARQFMTKLHIQVNQTLQFYRGQQGGSAPQRLYLSGGASIMPYTAQFFAEKLNVPVEYFNPFRNVQISPTVNLEELSRVAHSLGEVVGLGLRNLATCPVEMNLMPDSTLRWQSFNQKKPYLIATVASMVLVAFAVGFLFQKLADNKSREIDRLNPGLATADSKMKAFKAAYGNMQSARKNAEAVAELIQDRYYWGDFLMELRAALVRSEDVVRKQYASQKAGLDVGVWIEQMNLPGEVNAPAANGAPTAPPQPVATARYNMARAVRQEPVANASGNAIAANTNGLTLVCRAVSLKRTVNDSAHNKDIAFAVRDQLAASPMVDPGAAATQLQDEIAPDDPNGTFTFKVVVTPAKPLKF